MIVYDTNVVSELMKPTCDAGVLQWSNSRHPGEIFTTAITVGEVLYGVERLPSGRRRSVLEAAVADVFDNFVKVLAFDSAAAGHFARIAAAREQAGRPIGEFDAQIAAICRVHGATLATRNLRDFLGTGIELIDPWRASSS